MRACWIVSRICAHDARKSRIVIRDAEPSPGSRTSRNSGIANSPNRIADSGKLGHTELAHLCPLDRVQRMVVDAGITEEWKGIVRGKGIELIVAE